MSRLGYLFVLSIFTCGSFACTNAVVNLQLTYNSNGGPNFKFYLYTANTSGHNLSVFSVEPESGQVTTVGTVSMLGASSPKGLTSDPQNQYLIVSDGGYGNVDVYSINKGTGLLASVAGSPFDAGSGGWFLAFDPLSMNLFSFINSSSIYAIPFGELSGALGAATSTAATNSPSQGVVCGSYLYVNSNSTYISGYSIDPVTGALTSLFTNVTVGGNPEQLVCDQGHRFLYVANLNGQDISAFTINAATGALTSVAGSPFALSSYARSVAIHPNGNFLYATSDDGQIFSFSINQISGALANSTSVVSGTNPSSVIVDPSGRYVFNVNSGSNDLYAYMINTDGTLSPFSNPVGVTGASPVTIFAVQVH